MKRVFILALILSMVLCSCSDSRTSDPGSESTSAIPTISIPVYTPEPTLVPIITPELPYDDFTNMQMSSAAWMSYFKQGYENIDYELKMVDGNYYYYTVSAEKPKIKITDLYIYNIASGNLEFVCRIKNDNMEIYYDEFTEKECQEMIDMEQLDK